MSDSTRPDELTARLGAVSEPTPYERDMAKLRVAEYAHDADDCLELLRMLGLEAPGFTWVATSGVGERDKRRKVYTGGAA